jgi:carbonic anhydrase
MIDNSITITKDTQSAITPSEAVELLKSGNQRFVNRNPLNRDLNQQVSDTSKGQFPFAAVLGCIDSRVPAEVVFDQGIGDIFNTRIAGNFINTDILGSLEFACKVAGSKVIVVLGHSSCGAVKGACDDVKLGNLTSMLANITPAVNAVTDVPGERNSSNGTFVQSVVDKNVEFAIRDIRDQSDVLKSMEDAGEIAIVGAMYDVASGRVTFY